MYNIKNETLGGVEICGKAYVFSSDWWEHEWRGGAYYWQVYISDNEARQEEDSAVHPFWHQGHVMCEDKEINPLNILLLRHQLHKRAFYSLSCCSWVGRETTSLVRFGERLVSKPQYSTWHTKRSTTNIHKTVLEKSISFIPISPLCMCASVFPQTHSWSLDGFGSFLGDSRYDPGV